MRSSRDVSAVAKASQSFDATFDALKGILLREGQRLTVVVDTPVHYQVASPTLVDRVGRPLFVAGVQINKNYVSFHLMPIYASPDLVKGLSPGLRKRMQGKSCFNFKTIDREQVAELSALTKEGIKRFKNIKLPW